MSLLGKILIIANGVAAVGLLLLLSTDYGTRHLWAYSTFRHEMVLQGLPLDEDDIWNFPSEVTANEFTESTLKDVFATVGEKPVPTQVKEVERKRDELFDELDAQPAAKQAQTVKGILLALASTVEEQDKVFNLTKAADLRAELQKKFQEAISTEPPRDPDERRRAIAHLLYNLAPDAEWHQRVQVVVGLPAYEREAKTQAGDLEKMVQRTRDLAADEQRVFIRDYRDLIHHRTSELARQVDSLTQLLKDREAVRVKHDELVKGRNAEIDKLKESAAENKKITAAVRAEQGELEDKLFKAQHDLVSVFDENIKLERRMRRLELGR